MLSKLGEIGGSRHLRFRRQLPIDLHTTEPHRFLDGKGGHSLYVANCLEIGREPILRTVCSAKPRRES
jgi:hypothetical protein